jgi:hypothetical protein
MHRLRDSVVPCCLRAICLVLVVTVWSTPAVLGDQMHDAANAVGDFLRRAYPFPQFVDLEKGTVYTLNRDSYTGQTQIEQAGGTSVDFGPAPCAKEKQLALLVFSCFKRFISCDEQGYTYQKILMMPQTPTMILAGGRLSQLVKFSVMETVRVNFAEVVRIKKLNAFSFDWVQLENGERPHRTTIVDINGKEVDRLYPSKAFLNGLHVLCKNLK